jgi:hypothetical protein
MDSCSPSCQVRLPLGRGRHLRFGLRAPSIIQAAYRSGLYASGPGPTSPVKSTAMVANGFGRETVRALDVGVANLARPRTDRRDCVGTERLVGPQQFVLKVQLRPLEGLHGVLDVLFFFIMPGALGSWMSIWISGKVNRYIKGSAILNRKL